MGSEVGNWWNPGEQWEESIFLHKFREVEPLRMKLFQKC